MECCWYLSLVSRMFGRMLKNLGYIHFWVLLFMVYFFPYAFYRFNWFAKTLLYNTNFPLFDDLQNVNVLITTFALIGGAFQFSYTIFSSIFYGKKSVMNPWI
jgi:cytochrome c oxidase subunit 1